MARTESFDVKVPAQGVMRESVGMVLLNHVGSSSHQDSGRDAQILADRFGIMTIAADRPTSYRLPRDRQLAANLRTVPIKTMFNLAKGLDRAFSDFNIGSVIIAGRSAGGLGALELAQTEGISGAKLVYAAEPVGCRDLTVECGLERFKAYAKEQAVLLEEDNVREEPRLIHPVNDAKDLPRRTQMSRLATMVPLFFTDKYYNKEHWNQNLVPGYLANLALTLGLQTHVDFAEHSLVLPEAGDERNDFVAQLYTIAGEAPGTLSLDVIPGTTHASFDRRTFFAERIQTIAALQANITLPPAA